MREEKGKEKRRKYKGTRAARRKIKSCGNEDKGNEIKREINKKHNKKERKQKEKRRKN
jgi:hypothetical protein